MAADSPSPRHRGLRRLGGGLLSVVLGLGAVVLLMVFLNARDEAGVDRPSSGGGPAPGAPLADPERFLDGAQLRLLAAGDVFLLYRGARPPAALTALRDKLSGPPDRALEAAGQAVIVTRDRSVDGVLALAWRRILRTADPADPELEAFAAYWLGRGAAGD